MSPPDDTLTVMTLNLWNTNHWQERRDAVVAWINELRPGLVALQEVVRTPDECQATWLGQQTGMTAVFAAARAGAIDEFGNAVLSRLPIDDVRTLRLTDVGTGAEPRGALSVDVRTSRGVASFSTPHLSHLFDQGGLREAQVQQLADFVGSTAAGLRSCAAISTLGPTPPRCASSRVW